MSETFCLRPDLAPEGAASNLQFNEHIKFLQSKGKKIYHLGFGQSPFPVPSIAQKSLKDHAHVGQYLPIRGLMELREKICEFHSKEDNLDHFHASDIVVGPGSKELMFLLQAVTDGTVLLLSPTWTTYMPQAVLSKHKVVKLRTTFENNWKLTTKMLDEVFPQPAQAWSILILCNPDNPTGTSYSRHELEELSVKFRQYKILVISDEIYSRLSFNNDHVSLAKIYPEGTILSCGISKWASCGGWRLGYHMYPPQLRVLGQAVSNAASQTYTSASAPIQHASTELMKYGKECKSYVAHCKRILHAVALHCCEKLRSVGVKVMTPSSGYYIFPDFDLIRRELKHSRGINTGVAMCEALLNDTNVAVMAAGPAFLHNVDDLTVRLCYINFDGAVALQASEEVGLDRPLPSSFLNQFCAPTVEAIDLIVEWVNNLKENTSK